MTETGKKWAEIKKSLVNLSYPVGGVIVVIIIWYIVIFITKMPEYVLPLPTSIVHEFTSRTAFLIHHSYITAYETLLGFAAAIVIGFLISLSIVWSKTLERTVLPLLVFTQTMPKIAVAPLFLIWFGFGFIPKIVISFLVCFFPIVINTTVGLTSIDPEMMDLIKSMGAKKREIFLKVRIPNSMPYFFTGLKIGIVLALIGAVVGEFVGANEGLGYLILVATSNLKTALVFACIIILAVGGAILFYIISWLEKLLIPWQRAAEEAGKTISGIA